jgi:hypothetical protein
MVWKAAMAKSENIAKYIDHWYDDVNEYWFIVSWWRRSC